MFVCTIRCTEEFAHTSHWQITLLNTLFMPIYKIYVNLFGIRVDFRNHISIRGAKILQNIFNRKSVRKFFGSPYFMLKIYGNTRNLYRACSLQCSYIPKEFPNVFFFLTTFFFCLHCTPSQGQQATQKTETSCSTDMKAQKVQTQSIQSLAHTIQTFAMQLNVINV